MTHKGPHEIVGDPSAASRGGAAPNSCHYCGLPAEAVENERAYCCYGCRIADSIVGGDTDGGSESEAAWQLTRIGLAVFFAMNVTVLTLVQWSWDIYSDPALQTERAQTLFELLRYASLMLSTLVFMLLGTSLTANALRQLGHGRVTTDLLVALGVIAALIYSAVSVVTAGRHTYFEVACMVLVAMTLGRWLEATSKLKTTSLLRSLQRLLPTEARRVVGEEAAGWDEQTAPLGDIQVGDRVRVLPGERIPLDGVVLQGAAAVDEMIMTGESRPSVKQPGDTVFAGTQNQDGDLLLRVAADADGGAVQKIVDAVVQAAMSKSQVQLLADRVAGWMVPLVIALATVTLAVHASAASWGDGLMAALSVLLIACPCALGVATPLAMWAAMGRASEAGVLFRNGDTLQQLAEVDCFCFDKTGTLTTGTPVVESLVAAAGTRRRCRETALAAAASSTHVLSRSVVEHLRREGVTLSRPLSVRSIAGQGVEAALADGLQVRLGRFEWLRDSGWETTSAVEQAVSQAAAEGMPVVAIGWERRIQGVFLLTERERPESRDAMRQLAGAGAQLMVLTGDSSTRAESLESRWQMEVRSGLLPGQKQQLVRQLGDAGRRVAMVGDGVNDAPAMAAADVGIALGCGADVTRDAAGVCLLGDNLQRVAWSAALARRTMRVVKQNLVWAFAYNGIGIAWAMAGRLNPIGAAAAMVVSSLLVTTNSLRLGSYPLELPRPAAAADDNAEPSGVCPEAPAPAASQNIGASVQ